jgi:hypothetical protein
MKHTIKIPQGSITIEATGKPYKSICLVTLQKFPFPAFDVPLTAEVAALLSQAFDLVAEEIQADLPDTVSNLVERSAAAGVDITTELSHRLRA